MDCDPTGIEPRLRPGEDSRKLAGRAASLRSSKPHGAPGLGNPWLRPADSEGESFASGVGHGTLNDAPHINPQFAWRQRASTTMPGRIETALSRLPYDIKFRPSTNTAW